MLPRRLPPLAELLPVGPVRGAASATMHHSLPGTASCFRQRLSGCTMLRVSQKSAAQSAAAWHCRVPLSVYRPVALFLQIAIAATDLAEIIGSATALYLLFGLPVWAGVLITGVVSGGLHPSLHQPAMHINHTRACLAAVACLHRLPQRLLGAELVGLSAGRAVHPVLWYHELPGA